MGRQTQDRKKLIIPDFQGSLPATLSDIVAPSQRAAGERLLVRCGDPGVQPRPSRFLLAKNPFWNGLLKTLICRGSNARGTSGHKS